MERLICTLSNALQMVNIRLFKTSDTDDVIRVARKAWFHTYKDIFSKEKIEELLSIFYDPIHLVEGNTLKHSFWVAETDGKIIGYVTIGLENGEMKLFRIYLDPDYIGMGIGSKLLQTAETFMRQHGITKYYLEVHPKNTLGLSFYKRKGFVQSSRQPTDCSSECELVLEKTLD